MSVPGFAVVFLYLMNDDKSRKYLRVSFIKGGNLDQERILTFTLGLGQE